MRVVGKAPIGKERRKSGVASPQYEDSGLFKSGLVRIKAELVPSIGHSLRGDLIIKGFLEGDKSMDMLIVGRRVQFATHLLKTLKKVSIAPRRPSASSSDVWAKHLRLPVVMDGTWRMRVYHDNIQIQAKRYQFIVSEWHLESADGHTSSFGEPPAK